MRHIVALALGSWLAAACAQAPIPRQAVAAPPEQEPASRGAGVEARPLSAARGEIQSVTHGWFGPEYYVLFDDGETPPEGALLKVRRNGESVGTLVVVESGSAFTVLVLVQAEDGSARPQPVDVPGGVMPSVGSSWRFVDAGGVSREGVVDGVLQRPARFARPSWDGDEPLREGDAVIAGGRSMDALHEARRARWLE